LARPHNAQRLKSFVKKVGFTLGELVVLNRYRWLRG
jgi:hypothetical protein